MSQTGLDELFMMECLTLARNGAGRVSPNPLVGAVIVKHGKVLSRGYHRHFGGPHAEVEAIKASQRQVRGATMYVNLEPCNFFGKTPPCTNLLIESGIKRVVIGMRDPNPLVSGRGIAGLRKAGVQVVVGILEQECGTLNESFKKHVTTGLPFVTMKVAQTLDGMVADANGHSRWITGVDSRSIVHRLRSEVDAVLVGAGTIAADNPKLNVRMVTGRNPIRVILDGRFRSNTSANVFNGKTASNTILVASLSSTSRQKAKKELLQRRGVVIIEMAGKKDQSISLRAILKALGKKGIASVLVEGGSEVFRRFIVEKEVDKLLLFIAPCIYGKGIPAFSGLNSWASLRQSGPASSYVVGDDVLLEFHLNSTRRKA